MTLDDGLKVTQIAFYVAAGVVAILTYLKAKRGLLNTVNTEYQKKVIERLGSIADELLEEFDPASERYWRSRILSTRSFRRFTRKYVIIKPQSLLPGSCAAAVRAASRRCICREF